MTDLAWGWWLMAGTLAGQVVAGVVAYLRARPGMMRIEREMDARKAREGDRCR